MAATGIYGLSGSGLDIESLVKVGMMSKQSQYNKMQQQEITNTWKKEEWATIYDKMNNYNMNTLSTFKLQSNMNAMQASSSNKDLVSATANGAAASMTHQVTVNKMASNAYIMTDSGKTITRNGVKALPTSNELSDVVFKTYASAGKDSEGKNQYNVTLADGTAKLVKADDVAISLKIGDSVDEKGNITYKTVEFTYGDLFEEKKTLNDLGSAIAKSGANIQGGYDTTNDSFSFYNKTAGEKNIISLVGDNQETTDLLNALHLASYNAEDNSLTAMNSFTTGDAQEVKGTNSEAIIDGKKYSLDSNKITVAGVTYNFNGVSESGKSATITVSQDTDKIVDYVKQFVDEYNTLIDYMNDKLSEERYKDYKPLSSKQEEQMTESQVTKWNEKAKSGLLYHDTTLQGIVSNMRDALFAPVEAADGKYNSAGAIGISSVTIKGHIMLDEETLRKALAEEPNSVYKIFASDQDSSYVAGSTSKKPITNAQKKLDYANTGIANRLTTVMKEGLSTISDHAGTSKDTGDQSYLGKLITNLQTKMSTFKTQMSAYESMLYKRYDAMEVALQSFGTQLNYITGYGS